MDDPSKAERFGDFLDKRLEDEHVEAGDDDLSSLLEIARRLQKEAPVDESFLWKDEPDPEFQARLRRELIDGRPLESPAPPSRDGRYRWPLPSKASRATGLWRWSWRLGAACAALILIAITLWLSPLLRRQGEVGGNLAQLPSLLRVASAYAQQVSEDVEEEIRSQLGSASFRLMAALPKAPEKVRVYRQAQEPIDKVEAAFLAQRLGIVVSSVVDEPDYGVFVVSGEGGRLVVSKAFRGYFSFDKNAAPDSNPFQPSAPPPSIAPPGAVVTPAPDAAEATRVAREFLQSRGLLDFDHVVDVGSDAPAGGTPLYRQVTFVPTAEGRPVRGLGIVVTLGPQGMIMAIQFSYARLIPGDEYPIVKSDEVYQRLQENRLEAFQLRARSSSGSRGFSTASSSAFWLGRQRSQEAEMPKYQVGETVELEGLLSAIVYEAKDGRRRYNATLLTGPKESPTRMQYRLVGAPVESLIQLDQQHVRVWGRVEALTTNPPGGRLQVERYEKLYPGERLVALLGRLDIEGEGDDAALVLVTDDGMKYALETPSGVRSHREYRGRRVIVEGRTTQRTSKEGYPVVELVGTSSGSDIDRRTDLSGYQVLHPRVMPEREPILSGEVEVNRAALEYYAVAAAGLPPRFTPPDLEPFLLVQPIYSFSGTFDEGRGSFEAYVQAVRPEYVEGLR